jgi:hypothetical protein
VAFRCRDAADPELSGRYDLVTIFEALHDMSQPVDEESSPVYGFTCRFAKIQPPPAQMRQLLGAVSTNPKAMDDFVTFVRRSAVRSLPSRFALANGGSRATLP